MKYLDSFRLFFKAVRSTRHEMWISLQILIVLTILLSVLLFIVEHNAQPEVFNNYWDAFLWSWMGYIDDPGGFADYSPITTWGRILKVMCALVNIAIFAIPAGLLAGGFSAAIEDDKREKELLHMKGRLRKAFRRKYNKPTKLRVAPRYISPIDVQVLQEIDTKDIIDAVRNSDEFRLANLATAVPDYENPSDRLVVELIPQEGKTSYGCCIDRGSRVTIVAPSAVREVGTTNFAYYLALFGGFNYVSKEYLEDKDTPMSFYIIDKPDHSTQVMEYLKDLQRLSTGKDKWTIILIVADSVHEEDLFFVTKTLPSTEKESTIVDTETFNDLYIDLSEKMKKDFNLVTDIDNVYNPVGPKNVGVRIGGGASVNAFTVRIDWSIIAFDNRNIPIALSLAEIIAKNLEDKKIEIKPDFKESGSGYQLSNH